MTAPSISHRCASTRQMVELAEGSFDPDEARALLVAIEGCPECMAVLGEAGLEVAHQANDSQGGSYAAGFDSGTLAGTLLAGRYRLNRWLGRGGMGEVYEAHDLELDERVAVKTIVPDFARDEKALQRFRREVRLARQIVHPNVCRVLELGRESTGEGSTYFLTMELIEGETLREKIGREGPLDPATAIRICVQLCSGLLAIHEAGVLHRDVKPGNIMVSRSPTASEDDLVASLLDFGIARAFAGPGANRECSGVARVTSPSGGLSSTQTNTAVGTPDYMAPEQLSGQCLSEATDLYSLGVVFLEMLTGRPPGRSRGERRAAPLAPELSSIVAWCLQSEASKRPQTAAELREALDRMSSLDNGRRASGAGVRRLLGAAGVKKAAWVLVGGACLGLLASATTSFTQGSEVLRVSEPPATTRAADRTQPGSAPDNGFSTQPVGTHRTSTVPGVLSRRAVNERSGATRPGATHSGATHSGVVGTSEPPPEKPPMVPQSPLATHPTTTSAKVVHDGLERCNPPYYYDSSGLKTYRRECL